MMKVLIDPQIFSIQKYGGISRYFCELVGNFKNIKEISVKIVTPFYVNSYITSVDSADVIGCSCQDFFKNCNLRVCKTAIRVMSLVVGDLILSLYRPDIIHESYYLPFGLGLKKSKRVLTIYDMIHEKFPSQFSISDKVSRFKAIAAKRADHIICISESTRRDVIEMLNIDPKKISVVYLGFNSPTLVDCGSGFDFKNSAKPFLLYVGNRSGYKNFNSLIRAFSSSDLLMANYQLVCFGGGPIESEEIKLLKELGLEVNRELLFFSGDDDLLFYLYKNAQAFIYPSLYEGFGIPPLEAMACNCPVICSDASSIPEVVGDAGEYFNPYDIASIAKAVEYVVSSNSRMNQLRELGKIRLRKFSWERCASETAEVYKKLI